MHKRKLNQMNGIAQHATELSSGVLNSLFGDRQK